MRALTDAERIRRFMTALARAARAPARVYLTGGATAVLFGWRPTTIDVDLKIVPEHDELLRAIPALKESLQINVEFASPADFIPVRPGWEERSSFIEHIDPISFHHFDLYAQALAKAERGHAQDTADIRNMLTRGLIDAAGVRAEFAAIEPYLYRYPAIDPGAFRRAVEEALS